MAARRKTAKKKTAKRKPAKAASRKKTRRLAASSRARTVKKAAKRTPPKRAKAKPARRPVAKKPAVKPAARKPAATTKTGSALPAGVSITGAMTPDVAKVLTPAAIAFVVELERKFGAERKQLLARRKEVQAKLDAGTKPDFLAETAKIRAADWKVAPLPKDLLDRRVEITGPVDRKMIINALNSGANVFMADFEDSSTPTWANMIEGQANLRDAVAGTITFTDPVSKKFYKPNDKIATLLVRPRGWHLPEKHVLGRRPADVGLAVRFRALRLPQRQGAARQGQRSVFLSAEDGKPSRSAAVERGLRARARQARRASAARSRRPC